MKTAGVVENSGHCTYSIGLKCFLKLPFAISFSVFIYSIYIYIYIIYIHVIIKGFITTKDTSSCLRKGILLLKFKNCALCNGFKLWIYISIAQNCRYSIFGRRFSIPYIYSINMLKSTI